MEVTKSAFLNLLGFQEIFRRVLFKISHMCNLDLWNSKSLRIYLQSKCHQWHILSKFIRINFKIWIIQTTKVSTDKASIKLYLKIGILFKVITIREMKLIIWETQLFKWWIPSIIIKTLNSTILLMLILITKNHTKQLNLVKGSATRKQRKLKESQNSWPLLSK
jgi:hypothetical protein